MVMGRWPVNAGLAEPAFPSLALPTKKPSQGRPPLGRWRSLREAWLARANPRSLGFAQRLSCWPGFWLAEPTKPHTLAEGLLDRNDLTAVQSTTAQRCCCLARPKPGAGRRMAECHRLGLSDFTYLTPVYRRQRSLRAGGVGFANIQEEPGFARHAPPRWLRQLILGRGGLRPPSNACLVGRSPTNGRLLAASAKERVGALPAPTTASGYCSLALKGQRLHTCARLAKGHCSLPVRAEGRTGRPAARTHSRTHLRVRGGACCTYCACAVCCAVHGTIQHGTVHVPCRRHGTGRGTRVLSCSAGRRLLACRGVASAAGRTASAVSTCEARRPQDAVVA